MRRKLRGVLHAEASVEQKKPRASEIAIEKFLFTRKETAFSLGISVRTVDYRISQKLLDTRREGAKRLVTRESIRRYAARDHPEAISPREALRRETTRAKSRKLLDMPPDQT
jgi:hypothetical protein